MKNNVKTLEIKIKKITAALAQRNNESERDTLKRAVSDVVKRVKSGANFFGNGCNNT